MYQPFQGRVTKSQQLGEDSNIVQGVYAQTKIVA